jgi:hypothetical protein
MKVLGLTPLFTGKFFVVGLKAVHKGFVMHLHSIDTVHKYRSPTVLYFDTSEEEIQSSVGQITLRCFCNFSLSPWTTLAMKF